VNKVIGLSPLACVDVYPPQVLWCPDTTHCIGFQGCPSCHLPFW